MTTPPMMSEHQIRAELMDKFSRGTSSPDWVALSQWVISDRARIVEPLVALKKQYADIQWLARLEDEYCGTDKPCKAIDETLKLSGVRHDQ